MTPYSMDLRERVLKARATGWGTKAVVKVYRAAEQDGRK